MTEIAHRYVLEKYAGGKTRFQCPGCGHQNTFSRYVDSVSGEYVAAECGRCNREQSCGYHRKPHEFLSKKNETSARSYEYKAIIGKQTTPIRSLEVQSVIPKGIFQASLAGHDNNALIRFLCETIGEKKTIEAIEKYFIGTSKHWSGSTVFWQIDANGRIRAGKVMLYDAHTGKRVKEPQACITWVHKIIRIPDYELRQCFFGEHLLRADKDKTVAIVESEKTAIIASVYLPDFIWLASGGLNNINPERMEVLKRRRVILFPDANGYTKWKEKARQLPGYMVVGVSQLLEDKATDEEKAAGYDLADYLIKQPVPEPVVIETVVREIADEIEITEPIEYFRMKPELVVPLRKLEDWSERIARVESIIEKGYPDKEIMLGPGARITDIRKFITGHLGVVKANQGKVVFEPYLERLEQVCSLMEL